MMNYILRNM